MAKMTDERITALLTYGIGQSVGFSDSRLSKERERVERYYTGEFPKRPAPGRSAYNSLDVFDSVEDMHAQLLDTFTANFRPVRFLPAAGETEDQARMRTEVVSCEIFDYNPGFTILSTVIRDGLKGRSSVAKVHWEDRWETEYYDLTDVAFESVAAALTKEPTAEITEYELHDDGQTIKRLRYSVKKNRSCCRIVPLPPEEFGISPMSKSIRGSELCFHRSKKTVSELIKDGFDKKTVLSLQDNDRIWLETDSELLARFGQTDDLVGEQGLDNSQHARKRCMVYECYTELDIDDTGESQLYKITMVGDTILDKEPVSFRPFLSFTPIPRPHTFWGTNYAAQVIPTQQARTHLVRGIVDHMQITNNPRYQVVKGGLVTPRELQENRIGGIINVSRDGAVVPLEQPSLNPFVFQTHTLLGQEKERITSISQLAQGLDKDAISKQNSQGMVRDLITESQVRQKVIAREFAETFLRDLYTMVYRLMCQNADPNELRYVGGAWTPVDFTKWPDELRMKVEFTLGYGEQDKEAQKHVLIDKYLTSDPDLKQLYPMPKRFNNIRDALIAWGVNDVGAYLLSPDQAPPPQPNPMMQAEIEAKQADSMSKKAMAQAALGNLQIAQREAEIKAQQGMAKINLQTQKSVGDQQLKSAEFAHKVTVDTTEIMLEHQAQQTGHLTAVAQPTRQ